ncbi:hypothetical protein HN51_002658 [Arachis hypogaea]|uniref:SANT domain-containing protein n=3 Tax=Arachis TaxID=3817 RepID=A0A445EM00_ARAHY|nr:uncharacterized protein LOC107464222 [Arachis duranensis]XP_025611457.1 uncharacterized protein LOC112704131 [Arachis hypogaea]RYR76363.1 hypothetical protein Ahy_A01g000949 [Arachis hypogaea]
MWVSPTAAAASSMEVDEVQVNKLVNCVDEQADEQSLTPEFSDDYDNFGDPDVFPRVGQEYQVEIPSLISNSDYSWLQKNSHEAESTVSALHAFRVGLPIPLIRLTNEVGNYNHDHLKNACKSSTGVGKKIESSKLECVKETQGGPDYEKLNPKLEVTDSTLVDRMELGNPNVKQETKHGVKDLRLVPGAASDTWNEIEESSFILGLYIFGKNLVQVKKFIGNKKMGDILSFYYGKFYKSDRYQRWSGCRKMRSRKCIFGQKIFTGPRQQELLSRLLPNISDECRNKLHEVSKTFVEGKILLEDYVLTLKALVGLKVLVEAVGIGKGKEDLTGLAVDSMKSTQGLPLRPEIPVGKACSMLTSGEIISFLTGDFRLSKARTSDLFWEAVWPRLLARGWHSEQPSCYNYAVSSKNALVFLVPGVKKFSRKLVKGNHYFDSVSDVLGKVASDPELIELEKVADNGCTERDGNGWCEETKLDRENSPDQPRHCYLKVKPPNRSMDGMKFTVVDTSLVREKMKMVREVRSLPFEVLRSSAFENDSDTSEEQTNESESVNTMYYDRKKAGGGISSDLHGVESNPSKGELSISSMDSTALSAASKDQKTDLPNNTQRRDGMKCQSLQRMISDNKIDLVPAAKRRRRLTACSRPKKNVNTASLFIVPRVKQEEASFYPDTPKQSANVTAGLFFTPAVKQEKASDHAYNSGLCENVPSIKIPPQESNSLFGLPTQGNETLAGPVSNSSSIISTEAIPATSSSGTKDRHEKPLLRTLIDLNLPVAPEVQGDETSENEASDVQQKNTSKELEELSVATVSKPVDHSYHQPDIQTRRQSTRNRPPTAKVLEALAFGYLDRKEKRSRRDYHQDSSRPPRRRKAAGSGSGVTGLEKDEKANVVYNGNGNDNSSSNSNVLCTDFKSTEG